MNKLARIFLQKLLSSFGEYALKAKAISDREIAARERQLEKSEKTIEVTVIPLDKENIG